MTPIQRDPTLDRADELANRLARTVEYRGLAISPDGSHLAWAQTEAGETTPRIFICSTAPGAEPIGIELRPPAPRRDSDPAWSPDSRTLAFFSNPDPDGQPELWTVHADGTNPCLRARLKGYAARPQWSHDGTRIAFLYVAGGDGGGPLLAARSLTDAIRAYPRNQCIAVLDVNAGAVREVSPANLSFYVFDWSPDDTKFVGTAAPSPGDGNWYIAQIYVIDTSIGEARPIYKPVFQVAVPRWSPDAKRVAFIEGLMSDEGFFGGDLLTVCAEGGEARNHTGSQPITPNSLFWTSSDRILVTETTGGGSTISEVDLQTNTVRTLWRGPEDLHADGHFSNFTLARDGGVTAVARSSFERPPAVWVGKIGEWRQVTHANNGQVPAWGHVEDLQWTSDKWRVQGWLLSPKQVDPGRLYPLVVSVHGGPANVRKPSWPRMTSLEALFAAQGYFVLMPNPRGSFGQGEVFTRAIYRDFGGGDLRDIIAGVEAVMERYPVNPGRLGITGWSYGGFMTMWAVTQTQRFKVAMAGAGIANWQSYYGQNFIEQWLIPFFGATPYEDPCAYAKCSPINYIRNARTPTLILVGEEDAECPAAQSLEFWRGLSTYRVPTELVIYPGEGHLLQKLESAIDMQTRTLAWFDQYLQ